MSHKTWQILMTTALTSTLLATPAIADDDVVPTGASCDLFQLRNKKKTAQVAETIDAHLEAGRTEITVKKMGPFTVLVCAW